MTRRERRALGRQSKKLQPVRAEKPSWWYWLGPCIASGRIYAPSLWFGFIRNDRTQISEIGTLWVELSQPTHNFAKYYRPVATAWMWVVNLFAGFNPGVWHLSSILLHVIASYLVYRLAAKLLQNSAAAMVAALIFALHAVHNDAVLWILASNEILCAIGVLAAVLMFEEHAWWSLAAWTFALFSKETAIAMLPLLFILALRQQSTWRKTLRRFVPYLGASILYLGIRALVVPSGAVGGKLMGLPWRATFYTAPFVVAGYLRKLFWPAGLSPMYGLHLRFTSSPVMWLAAGAIVLGLSALVLLGKKDFLFTVAAALITLPLAPAIYAMRFSPNIEMIADRYLYLPSVGLCLLLGWFAKRMLASQRRAAIKGVASLATVLGILCFGQEGFYANEAANFTRAAEFAPDDQWVVLQLANAYALEGKYDESLAQYQRACAIDGNLDCVTGLAQGFYFTHRYAEALPRLQTIARLLDHTDSGRNPTTLVQHEEYLLWLADTQRKLGDSPAADETAKRAQVIASEIYAEPEADALARAFKIPTLPAQVNR